jgi:hypothetical protein
MVIIQVRFYFPKKIQVHAARRAQIVTLNHSMLLYENLNTRARANHDSFLAIIHGSLNEKPFLGTIEIHLIT